MKKITRIISIFISIIVLVSCKNVKIEDDYYYTETETIDGMKITLKGNGYGYYGQLIEKYKTGTIGSLMNGTPMKIRTSSADDKNSTYNEIFLTFEKNGHIASFETDIEALYVPGMAQIRVYYTDENDKDYSLYTYSKEPFSGKVNVNKDVKSITLYIKAYKFYPNSYSSLNFKGDLTSETYEELKGSQVNNEITINYVRVE